MGIIYFSLDKWSRWFKRKQHLTQEFSRLGIDVIYVEPGPPLKKRVAFLLKHLFLKFSELKKLDNHLTVLTIYLTLPYHPELIPTFFKILITCVNKLFWGLIVKKYVKSYLNSRIVFFINSIYTYPDKLIDSARKKYRNNIVLTVYDCVDILEEFPNIDKKLAQYWEKKAISQSDLVFVSAKNLAQRAVMKKAKSVHFIPNGVEFELFEQACKNPIIPDDIKNVKQQGYYLFGYVGTLDEWVDFKLLEKFLEVNKRIIICLVGSCISQGFVKQFTKISKFLKAKYYRRFYYLGPKPYNEIPHYINAFDCCLIPFKPSQLISGVNPIKLYEYFACGKGVVSTYWQEIGRFENIVSFIRKESDIETAIHKEIQRLNKVEIKKRRLETAKFYDWHRIVKSAWEILTNKIKENELLQ